MVSTTCGLRPKARQIRDTDDCDRPVPAAIVLVDQWLSCPGPRSVSVRATCASTYSSVILRGSGPGRAGEGVEPTLHDAVRLRDSASSDPR